MNVLSKLSVGAKLLLAPMVVLALLLLLAATAYHGIQRQQEALNNIYQVRFKNYRLVSEASGVTQGIYGSTYQLLSSAAANFPAQRLEAMVQDLQDRLKLVERLLDEVAGSADLAESEKSELATVAAQFAGFRKSTADVLDIAAVDYASATSVMSLTANEFEALDKRFRALLDLEQKLSNAAYDAAGQTSGFVVGMLALVAAVSIFLALTVSFFVRRHMIAAVERIKSAAMELKGGDLTKRVGLEGSDEIAQTANAFNDLIASFQQAVRQVLGEARAVSLASQELGATARVVAERSTRQADATSAVAATMEEMTVSISSISENAEHVKDTSRTSLENTKAGGDHLIELLDEISRVGRAFKDITSSVGEFVRNTASINDMTRQVKDLADQTNLLALNAAIEAARAGEQGRGFAVVADEVRKLAERSTEAAVHIEEVTRTLGGQSEVVEQSLNEGTHSLESSQRHLEELEQIIRTAKESVSNASRGMDEIAAAVREQSTGSNDIARNIDEIARMVEENSNATRQSSQAVLELEQLSRNLELAVGNFRV
ncbi:MAG: methyl-accepting chemotaxis protein [Rhodocyclales bacterium]|jgi:methyl-accepting chemotaxis protein|nr:methyl-accepting chemotaxis protein [Rhodocyclaceae bacterium]PWB40404.1 MAG: methyl-accepting chemotaxis protein [Rhodocyclales bacterium]GIK23991.1 MAG: methyl-accepting chemotaxis protein [Betaproteobacteria bacterium]